VIYVFDTSAFIELFRHFYPSRFPTLWDSFDDLVERECIVSVREVLNEVTRYHVNDRLAEWVNGHKEVFATPSTDELSTVRSIFENQHFRMLISKKSMLQGTPVADPFIVARAHRRGAVVVSQEEYKPNAAKIPNVCESLDVECVTLAACRTLRAQGI
jgi:hypothetical protein